MNYELAKELQNAGFKVQPHSDDDRGCYNECHVPTLEELIKACGNDFLELHKNLADDEIDFGWFASTIDTIRDQSLSNALRGKTAEEAVARLWLYVNKKSYIKYDPNKLYYTPKERFYRCIKKNKQLKSIIGDVFEWEEDIKAYIHKDNYGKKKASAFSKYTVKELSLLHILKLIDTQKNFIEIYPQT